MANQNIGVHVTGIPELSRALKAVDKELYRELRLGMKAIAASVIQHAESRGAPAGVLRPRATQKGAGIAFPKGGPESRTDRDGYYPWLDFGGGDPHARGVTANRSGGSPRREIVSGGGRYLYPAVAERLDNIGDEMGDLVEKVARRQGFEVRG